MSQNAAPIDFDRDAHKPGRNHLCYCGSGRKYKKCHLDPDRDAAQVFKAALRALVARQAKDAALREKLRREYSLYINIVPPVEWEGGKAWAIGHRLYPHRPPGETFHEFLISLLRETFTEEWRLAQVALPEHKQHFLLKCSDEWTKFKAANSDEGNRDSDGLFSAQANGWVQFLISLAWDVAMLIHATDLPPKLVQRLRAHDQFQGARYEAAVAAMFARLDCEIEFIDDDEQRGEKHPEFIATHRPTGTRVAVEAKSRHRQGVLNVGGSHDEDDVVPGDVEGLFRKAKAKAPGDVPFLIFIDVNALPTSNLWAESQWQTDVKAWMEKAYPPNAAGRQRFGALAVTNFSPHYDGDELARGSEWLYFHPPNPALPLDDGFSAIVRQALDQYHRVPEITEDREIRG